MAYPVVPQQVGFATRLHPYGLLGDNCNDLLCFCRSRNRSR
jgi:hypothetical protein